MTDKEKITALTEMGFTIDEAIALAKGNYRTVPDPKQEPAADPKPKPAADPKQDPQDLSAVLDNFGKNLAKTISETLVAQNILQAQQPAKMETTDILGLMLEPKAPEM